MNIELLNEIPSPLDPRDVSLEEILEETKEEFILPEVLDYRNDLPSAWNQMVDGPCSAYSAAAIKQWHEYKNYKLKKDLSRRFVYVMRKNFPDKGMFARDTMDILLKYGIPLDRTFKWKFKKRKDITELVFKEASNHKILAYARIYSIDGLKKALFKNGPCYITFPVYNNEMYFWKKNKTTDRFLGGHACVVVGYNENGFIIRNSWGFNWGDKGHTIFPYSDWGIEYETWTLIDDLESIDIIKRKVEERQNIFKRIIKFITGIFSKKG
jgi:hypothetical protein